MTVALIGERNLDNVNHLPTEEAFEHLSVETEWVDSGVGHAHKYYELTDRGRATAKAMAGAWREFTAALTALALASSVARSA